MTEMHLSPAGPAIISGTQSYGPGTVPQFGGSGGSPAPVPEPANLIMLAAGALCLLAHAYRWRTCVLAQHRVGNTLRRSPNSWESAKLAPQLGDANGIPHPPAIVIHSFECRRIYHASS